MGLPPVPKPGGFLKNLALTLLDFFLPRLCVFCGAGLDPTAPVAVCPDCAAQTEWVAGPLCPCCGRVFTLREGADHLCSECQTHPPPFARARAGVLYDEEGPSGRAIKGFKYGRRLDMLPVLLHWLHAPWCRELAEAADLVLPVPLHPRRLRERGFNQALLLAQGLAPAKLKRDLLRRVRHTKPQAGLNPKERGENVKGAFALTHPSLVAGKNLLLVDDVLTTGATVRECAKVLLKAGAARVDIITVARVRFK
jgi:ComF family protein